MNTAPKPSPAEKALLYISRQEEGTLYHTEALGYSPQRIPGGISWKSISRLTSKGFILAEQKRGCTISGAWSEHTFKLTAAGRKAADKISAILASQKA